MRRCQKCGFPADENVRSCPKCDALLRVQTDGSSATIDVAHRQETVAEALGKLRSALRPQSSGDSKRIASPSGARFSSADIGSGIEPSSIVSVIVLIFIPFSSRVPVYKKSPPRAVGCEGNVPLVSYSDGRGPTAVAGGKPPAEIIGTILHHI